MGTYYMYVDIKWNGKSNNKQFSVSCYAPQEITFIKECSTEY